MLDAINISEIKFDSAGLVPAIAQDRKTGDVLMLAYMNRESLTKTLSGGRACFYSRSRKKLWLKGESSGNFLTVRSIAYDCDGDTLLLSVDAAGPACHTGERSCFYRELLPSTSNAEYSGQSNHAVLEVLQKVLEERKTAPVDSSYTASLYAGGAKAILAKVAEEAEEFIQAAVHEPDKALVSEAADLLFHTMVMLCQRGLSIEAVLDELSRRSGTSGLEEKRRRSKKGATHG